ncbi:MAG TPA: DEAD/DEAH box helicase [Cyclobacteriaceae bacterium]|nr:DEAD/DEAH box helicase [Cyclobacteriaceae bacterium]
MSSFQALGLSNALLETIQQMGFETPTPIQEKAIPFLLQESRDLVALAQTGTGKTAAFGLPLIELCSNETGITQALVLAPTRELCVQIAGDLNKFSDKVKPLNIVPVYGGASITDQIRKIRRGAHIIVATPGRLMDLMERKVIRIESIRFVVLDEADEMLNMGFKEDIDHILADTPETKKVWLFSATMPREVRTIAQAYMTDPLELTIGQQNTGNVNIEHQYVVVDDRHRYDALKRIVDYNIDIFGVIFCRTKIETQKIAENLMRDGYNADALHGDLTQQQRDKVMGAFKNKTLQLLVATDVAARGIDVSNITHVIHLNLPDEIEFYTHRSGRTARAGKKGISIAIVTRREAGKIRQIEKAINSKIEKKMVPTGEQVCQARLLNLVHRLREVQVVEEEISDFLPSVYSELLDLSKEDIIKRFTSLEFNHLLDYYRGAPDLNQAKVSEGDYGAERFTTGDRLFINLGKMDGLDKGRLLSLVCDRTGVKGKDIGKIDVKGAYSFFEVEKSLTERVRQHLHGFDYKGRIVRVEVTGERSSDAPPKKKRSFEKKDFKKKDYPRKDYSKKDQPSKDFTKKSSSGGDDDWFDKKIKNLHK